MLKVASSPVGAVTVSFIVLPESVALLTFIGGKACEVTTPPYSAPPMRRSSITKSKAWPCAVSATDHLPVGSTAAAAGAGAGVGAGIGAGVLDGAGVALLHAEARVSIAASAMAERVRIRESSE